MSERPPMPLADAVASVSDSVMPPPGEFSCRGGCGSVIERPGLCDECGEAQIARERQAFQRRIIAREIPERFRWAHWAAPALAERVRGGASRVEAVRTACASGRAVLVAPGGRGKTSLACAWLRERIESGDARARFTAAHDLASPSYLEGVSRLELALTATSLVLDDLGAELAAAQADSGLAAQRQDAIVRLVRTRHDQGLGVVVTTAHGPEAIAKLYGDGVARRVFEGAAMVKL